MSAPDSLRVLQYLRALDTDAIAQLLADRRVPLRGIHEPLDLAEWCCEEQSVAAALKRLPLRQVIAMRQETAEAISTALSLALAAPAGTDTNTVELLDTTRTVLAQCIPTVPVYDERPAATPAATTSSIGADAGILQAFESAQLASDLLWQLHHQDIPVRTDRHGTRLRSIDLRRVARQMLPADAAVTVELGRLLEQAGLVAPLGQRWAMTDAGQSFLVSSHVDRWCTLASTWFDGLPASSLTPANEPPADMPLAVQLGILQAGAVVQDASGEIGTVGNMQRTPLGACVLNGDIDRARALAAEHFPIPVAQVYVQPDCTVISPGPLAGSDDLFLREIAQLEQRAMASQFRITETSVLSALRHGLSQHDVTAGLERLSCTGLPQPVRYLIEQCAARIGVVRVRPTPTGCFIRALESNIHEAIRIDTALSAIAPVETRTASGVEFATRVSAGTALATLIEARYPAALEDESGNMLPLTPPLASSSPAAVELPEEITELAEQLHETLKQSAPDDEQTWVRRKLELARRDRAWVSIEIAIPRRDPVELVLLPLAVTDQRVRARDSEAEVERTIPLRSIIAVHELETDAEDSSDEQ